MNFKFSILVKLKTKLKVDADLNLKYFFSIKTLNKDAYATMKVAEISV